MLKQDKNFFPYNDDITCTKQEVSKYYRYIFKLKEMI